MRWFTGTRPLSIRLRRAGARIAQRIGHERRKPRPLVAGSVQSELGPAPQHVVGSLRRRFVRHQIADLGRRQVGAEVWSEIVEAPGGRQDVADPRARRPAPGGGRGSRSGTDRRAAARRSASSMPSTSKSPPGSGAPLVRVWPRAEHRRELFVGLLGETAIGRDLAAVDRQQRRLDRRRARAPAHSRAACPAASLPACVLLHRAGARLRTTRSHRPETPLCRK